MGDRLAFSKVHGDEYNDERQAHHSIEPHQKQSFGAVAGASLGHRMRSELLQVSELDGGSLRALTACRALSAGVDGSLCDQKHGRTPKLT
jgi:hypothetical protein